LLSREPLYTAMTRSQGRLTLPVQRSKRGNPLRIGRDRSVLEARDSSVLSRPSEADRRLSQKPMLVCVPRSTT
jgi:ATP-dependent exoDNAse (exonuclease V) alpha subunit